MSSGSQTIRRAAGWSRLRGGRWLQSSFLLLVPVALLTLQMWINYHSVHISDLRSLYFSHHLVRHPFPYVDVPIQYPVLTGLFMTGAAAITHGLHAYLTVSSIGLWVCGVGSVCVLWSLTRKAAWCFALCPLLLVYSLLNWDLLAIFLMLLGWHAWTRDRHSLAALWLTLGTFAKLYPAFLLLFCIIELTRRVVAGQVSRVVLARVVAVSVAVTLAVNAPFAILAYHNWLYFWAFNAGRNENADLLAWLHLLSHANIATTNFVLTTVVVLAMAVGVVAVWRGVPLAHTTALVFCVFMLMQKIYSPQYTIWVVAFALVAGWEPWLIAALSLMGLSNYTSAEVHIALVRSDSRLVPWYNRHVVRWVQGERLLTTIAVGTVAAWRAANPALASSGAD